MSKTRRSYRDEYDDEYDSYDYEEYRSHKKEKRLKSALKTRDIDELLNMEDDEY